MLHYNNVYQIGPVSRTPNLFIEAKNDVEITYAGNRQQYVSKDFQIQ